ncbi:MAG: ATP-dependent sacrificial sulfur transferase LarE, partial [Planctomycetes bacterium]|nr:ATP-dependent sacrificial sulfur transferase LarE [Planctomycetota bacterium]
YSGGVDSAFLLLVARAVLGDRARAVLGVSDSVDRGELRDALELAQRIGAVVDLVETREFDNPDYLRNAPDRCYHCKSELFSAIQEHAREQGIAHVLDGSHAGDSGDYRPGLRARDERGVRSPLMEAGLDKERIREYSRRLGLPTWDKPAAPCLSSRIPYGQEVSPEKLRAVEAAERCLRDLGFRVARVRHHGEIARIEVEPSRLRDLLDPAILARVVEGIRAAGFLYATVDLEGFRSGSLNRALPPAAAGADRAAGGGSSSRLVQIDSPPPAGESA